MDEGTAIPPESHLREYLDVLRRRKYVVAIALLVTPLAAIAISLSQPTLYQSSADLLLNRQNVNAALTNTTDPSTYLQPDRVAQTEADLARQDDVARAVVAAARPAMRDAGIRQWSAAEFLSASSATVKPNTNLLQLSVTAPVGTLATRLATVYAYEFTAYRRRLDTASYRRAAAQLEKAIEPLVRAHEEDTALYANLVDKLQQVRTLEALQTPSHVVRANGGAVQVQPQPKRVLLLGVLAGCVLGIFLAFGWEALDTRVRSVDEIRERLGLPLLARVPKPRRELREAGVLVTEAEPFSVDADAFRLLRANLDFVNRDRQAKTIMITSALPGEGKSTTAANLAVALTRIGRRVVLVDLDLRRPMLHRLFQLGSNGGLTNVALGQVPLVAALNDVTMSGNGAPVVHTDGQTESTWVLTARGPQAATTAVANATPATLEVLTAGEVGHSAEIVGAPVLAQILEDLALRADVVLIDGPPLLSSSDGVTLSGKVDGVVVVTRFDTADRRTLAELRRVLETSRATALGVVVTGTRNGPEYRYYGDRSTASADVPSPSRVPSPSDDSKEAAGGSRWSPRDPTETDVHA